MKKLLLILTLLSTSAFAADQVNLIGSESVTVFCQETVAGECPEVKVDEWATHGGSHKYLAKKTNLDCRECHGDDLRGSSKSIEDVASTCIAPDKFRMPDNATSNERWISVDPTGELKNIVGTSIARIDTGDMVGCQMCHDEVEFHDENGNEIEMKVRTEDEKY